MFTDVKLIVFYANVIFIFDDYNNYDNNNDDDGGGGGCRGAAAMVSVEAPNDEFR